MLSTRTRTFAVIACAAVSFSLMCLWSYTGTIDNIRLSVWHEPHVSVNIDRGSMEWRHIYARKNYVADADFYDLKRNPQRINPRTAPVLGFWYSTGHEMGEKWPHETGMTRLVDYSLVIIPLWVLIGITMAPRILWLHRWLRVRRMRAVGFEVAPNSR